MHLVDAIRTVTPDTSALQEEPGGESATSAHIRIGPPVASQDDELLRVDETQFRLLEWTQGQAPSERLAAQILDAEGFNDIDPSHPLGGKDGGRDGHCTKDGEPWTWAVYFPRGQKDLDEIESKLSGDVEAARKHNPKGVAFVTNQEIRLAERAKLRSLGGDITIDLFHLERVATILDRPRMAPIRQQYLRIGAGRPPVRVKAEVIGAARAFTRDDELLESYVEEYEKHIREKSDEAWAKVKADEEKKARAEAEKVRTQAEKAARAAEEARRQAVAEARAENKPIGLQELASQSVPKFNINDMIKFDEIMPKINIDHMLPKYNLGSYVNVGGQFGPPGLTEPAPPPSKPLSDKDIDEKVANYRAELEARWESCKAYLAGVAWPGLKFRIHNAEGFLTNVQVVLTFHGARGLDHEYIESFVWEKLEDPSWKEPFERYNIRIPMAAPPLLPRSADEYPVEWEHDDNGDLVVKITLAQLRPHEVWTSDDDDVVLMLSDESLDSVEVRYTVTAYEHHDRPEGEPFTVPVEKVDIFDTVTDAIEASKNVE